MMMVVMLMLSILVVMMTVFVMIMILIMTTTVLFSFPVMPLPPLAINCADRPYNDPAIIAAQILTIVSLCFLWTNWIAFGAAFIPFVMLQVGKQELCCTL
jgi:hypothetical protein